MIVAGADSNGAVSGVARCHILDEGLAWEIHVRQQRVLLRGGDA